VLKMKVMAISPLSIPKSRINQVEARPAFLWVGIFATVILKVSMAGRRLCRSALTASVLTGPTLSPGGLTLRDDTHSIGTGTRAGAATPKDTHTPMIFSEQLLQEWTWSERYREQPEILL
jgi:hypothetical protein